MTDQNNSEGAIIVHYENNIHLQNEEHTKMQVVPVLSAKLHIKQLPLPTFLKWFNMNLGWPGHGFSKTAPKVKKPGKTGTNRQGDIRPCRGVN